MFALTHLLQLTLLQLFLLHGETTYLFPFILASVYLLNVSLSKLTGTKPFRPIASDNHGFHLLRLTNVRFDKPTLGPVHISSWFDWGKKKSKKPHFIREYEADRRQVEQKGSKTRSFLDFVCQGGSYRFIIYMTQYVTSLNRIWASLITVPELQSSLLQSNDTDIQLYSWNFIYL